MEAALPDEVKEKGLPIEFWFQDEARVGQQGTLSRVWAPIGSRPAMVRDNRRANAYIYGAICPMPPRRRGSRHGDGQYRSHERTPEGNQRQVASGAHAVLICDGAGWHAKSKEIVVPSNITLVTLPAYSPELNPMENVWEFLRDNRFGAQVWKIIQRGRSRLLRCMELVRFRRSADRIYRNPRMGVSLGGLVL